MTGPRTVLAGFGAGVTESLLAVTPTESIKTTLYAHLLFSPNGQTPADSAPSQNRRPQIRQPPPARLPPRGPHHRPRARHPRLLPGLRADDGAAGRQQRDALRLL